MKLLKFVNEGIVAATASADVSAYAAPIFSKIAKRNAPKEAATPKKVTRKSNVTNEEYHILKSAVRAIQQEAFSNGSRSDGKVQMGYAKILSHLIPLIKFTKLIESSQGTDSGASFDKVGVISKLKSLEADEKANNKEVTVFGLDDEDGNIIKVTIKNSEASEFEKVLQTHLASNDDNNTDVLEIPEILYKLKDQFTIINVSWPEIEEDEEENGELADDGQGGNAEGGEGDLLGGFGGDQTNNGTEGGELDLDGSNQPNNGLSNPAGEDESGTKSLLQQIISMMQADAEARKADANSRTAEAKAREYEQEGNLIRKKVKQEEEFLDMDEREKSQQVQDKHIKKLAKLSNWKRKAGMGDYGDETPKRASSRNDDDDMDDYESLEDFSNLGGSGESSVENEESSYRKITPNRKSKSRRRRMTPGDITNLIMDNMGK